MTTLPANWRELPAGQELDRVIAEALGWKNIHLPYTLLVGEYPDGGEDFVPKFSTSADAALTLPLKSDTSMMVEITGGIARCYMIDHLEELPHGEFSGPFAEAYCKSWCSWQVEWEE